MDEILKIHCVEFNEIGHCLIGAKEGDKIEIIGLPEIGSVTVDVLVNELNELPEHRASYNVDCISHFRGSSDLFRKDQLFVDLGRYVVCSMKGKNVKDSSWLYPNCNNKYGFEIEIQGMSLILGYSKR